MADEFARAGYGGEDIGFGERPALLVVDFQRAFTDPTFATGQSPHIHKAAQQTAELLAVARRCGIPVAKCYTAYESTKEMPYWKVASLYTDFFHGSPATEIDPKLHDPDYDYTFSKIGPSIFFNSPVTTFLARHRVDTVLLTGCTTSGCIRASVIDSFSHGYRTSMVEDCCGDQGEGPHNDNIRDVGRRYCDIVNSSAAAAYFEDIRKRNS